MMPMFILMCGALAALAMVYFAFSGPSPAKARSRRLEDVKDRHSKSQEVAERVQLKRIMSYRDTRTDGGGSSLIPSPALLRSRIEQTGKAWTLRQYATASVGIGFAIGLLLIIQGMPPLLALFVGLFAGIGIPHFVISQLIKRRLAQFTARFPDAIELMVRGLRSGLPISETINVVATEVPGPVGVEFHAVSDKMKIGRTMEAALQETADRLKTPEFQFFVISLAIQRETGGNLAETLANLSDVLRKRAGMKLKIRAMSSESKASAYILGALPFIVFTLIWFINGTYMQAFFTEPRLIAIGLGGLVWMSIGAFIMAKMISFEI